MLMKNRMFRVNARASKQTGNEDMLGFPEGKNNEAFLAFGYRDSIVFR